jgi:hypothetical protein
LVLAIETLLDVTTLTVEEITGRLKAAEEEDEEPGQKPLSVGGKLYYTEDQWLDRYRKKEQESNRGGAGSSNRGKRRGGGKGRGNGAGRPNTVDGAGGSKPRNDDKCKYCGKGGHWAKECRSRLRDEARAQANVAQDDEPTLLLIHGGQALAVTSSALSPSSNAMKAASATPTSTPEVDAHAAVPVLHQQHRNSSAPATKPIHLVEAKVFATFADKSDDPGRWILDTGASNHMTGVRGAFVDLDTGITGTVGMAR